MHVKLYLPLTSADKPHKFDSKKFKYESLHKRVIWLLKRIIRILAFQNDIVNRTSKNITFSNKTEFQKLCRFSIKIKSKIYNVFQYKYISKIILFYNIIWISKNIVFSNINWIHENIAFCNRKHVWKIPTRKM